MQPLRLAHFHLTGCGFPTDEHSLELSLRGLQLSSDLAGANGAIAGEIEVGIFELGAQLRDPSFPLGDLK